MKLSKAVLASIRVRKSFSMALAAYRRECREGWMGEDGAASIYWVSGWERGYLAAKRERNRK